MLIKEFVDNLIRYNDNLILSWHVCSDNSVLPQNILFLGGKVPVSNAIYLCDRSSLFKTLGNDSFPDSLFICHKRTMGDTPVFALHDSYNYIETYLPFDELYNFISSQLSLVHTVKFKSTMVSNFYEDVFFNGNKGTKNVHEKILNLPFPLKETNFLFVSDSPTGYNGRITEYITRLTELLPGHNIGEYHNKIIVIISIDNQKIQLPSLGKNSGLTALLEEYNVYATVSSSFFYIENLPHIYAMVEEALRISINIPQKHTEKPRILYPQYFVPYLITSFCHKHCIENYNSDSFVYLIHPGTIALLRYDKLHDSNLADTLFSYLINGRNLTKTSSDLFMHPNTVINKIKKITSLIDCNLEDPHERMLLLFSQTFVTYSEKICNMNLLERE